MQINIFKGEVVGIDKLDQNTQNAQFTQNIDISTVGEITNKNLGYVRQNNTALANPLVSIIQLKTSETIIHVNDL
jgi:acetylglutamate kinase